MFSLGGSVGSGSSVGVVVGDSAVSVYFTEATVADFAFVKI